MMIIKRKNFSKKDDNKSDLSKAALSSLGGGATLVGGVVGGNKVLDLVTIKSGKLLDDSELTAKDKDIIKDKLIKEAKKQGTKIIKDDNYDNSSYSGSSEGRNWKNRQGRKIKKMPKEKREEALKNLHKKYPWDRLKHLGKDRIILGKGSNSEVDLLSHELGHSKYTAKGRSKNIIAKGAHKLMNLSKAVSNSPGGLLGSAYGYATGVTQSLKERKGEKVSLWDKSKPVIVPAAITAPLLIAEGAASLKGLRMMKKAGASKELMKQARKRLGAAWGTYAGQASKPIVGGIVGNAAGKLQVKIGGDIYDKKD